MSVATKTIIHKMINELQQAKEYENNQSAMVRHIMNIRLLCDLIIEENSSLGNEKEQMNEQMRHMIKTDQLKHNQDKQIDKTLSDSGTIDHGEANGDSIFDF